MCWFVVHSKPAQEKGEKMKAKELISILKQNPEAEVIVSKDEEGNGYFTVDKKGVDVLLNSFVFYPYLDVTSYVESEQIKVVDMLKSAPTRSGQWK